MLKQKNVRILKGLTHLPVASVRNHFSCFRAPRLIIKRFDTCNSNNKLERCILSSSLSPKRVSAKILWSLVFFIITSDKPLMRKPVWEDHFPPLAFWRCCSTDVEAPSETNKQLYPYMSLGVGGMGGGWGLKYPLPPMKFLLKATLPLPKMAFLKKFLTFLAKKCHFFRKFLGPLGIITNLK